MKRKPLIFVSIILVLIALGIICITASRTSIAKPVTFASAEQQARSQPNLPNCLAASSQNVPKEQLKDITSVVGAKLIDLPRGTAYAVFFKTYNSQKASGTIVYDVVGDTFNFAVNYTNSKWQLSQFGACNYRPTVE